MKSDLERFLDLTRVQAGRDSCWPWRGSLRNGYSMFSLRGAPAIPGHRYAFQAIGRRRLPSAALLLHSCGNKACVRPTHLRPGDARQNALDALADGRLAGVKLTPLDVRNLRAAHATGAASWSELAAQFNVSARQCRRIVSRENWRHVE